jgi:DNA mismatch repair protein MutL
LIRVSDNGVGMSHDDALLSLERYGTSKIYKDQDLFSINTLGFRGEALPSIASVSQFTLVTRNASSDTGTEIKVDGGTIKKVSEVGAPKGTMVTVRRLFFNTPARRKFLKTVGTEMGHIADKVASIALGLPAVQFRLTHNDKVVKNWTVASTPFDRIVNILGSDLKSSLHDIEFQDNGISISGWTSSPRVTRRTSRSLYIFVNGRLVRDRIIQHALFEGYSQRLVKGQFPVAVIFINVPFDEVDVNVHPAKNEIRFVRQREVHEAVRRAVAQTLYDVDRPGWEPSKSSGNSGFPIPYRVSETAIEEFGLRPGQVPAPEGMRDAEGGNIRTDFRARGEIPDIDEPADRSFSTEPESRSVKPGMHSRDHADRLSQVPIWQKKRFGGMRTIGQLYNTYIVCESEKGLILVDQHAAHERILFEQFNARETDSQTSSQRLLVPETFELGYREAGVLEKLMPELRVMGLDIEAFGGSTFVVKAVPLFLAGREIKPLVIEIVEKIIEIGSSSSLSGMLDESRMIMACHGAIRAGQSLSDRQIQALLDQLDQCRNPSHCPHGRPTWIRWDIRTLEKSFKRIV